MAVAVVTEEDLAFARRTERFLLTHTPVVFASAQVDPSTKKVHVWVGVPHGTPEYRRVALRQSVERQVHGHLGDLVIVVGATEEELSHVPNRSQQA